LVVQATSIIVKKIVCLLKNIWLARIMLTIDTSNNIIARKRVHRTFQSNYFEDFTVVLHVILILFEGVEPLEPIRMLTREVEYFSKVVSCVLYRFDHNRSFNVFVDHHVLHSTCNGEYEGICTRPLNLLLFSAPQGRSLLLHLAYSALEVEYCCG
jgi:hypothetical protein